MTPKIIGAMRTLGVPYEEGYEDVANNDLDAQAQKIVDELSVEFAVEKDKEIVAMIAYLKRLGTDITANKE